MITTDINDKYRQGNWTQQQAPPASRESWWSCKQTVHSWPSGTQSDTGTQLPVKHRPPLTPFWDHAKSATVPDSGRTSGMLTNYCDPETPAEYSTGIHNWNMIQEYDTGLRLWSCGCLAVRTRTGCYPRWLRQKDTWPLSIAMHT